MTEPGKGSVGNIQARDHVIKQFLKHRPEGVAEISISHTDSDGNIRQQKVGANGSVSPSKITQRSEKSLYKAANKIYGKTCSKSKVGFSGSCSQEQWNSIFGKKEKKEGGDSA
jgi:hypothetical protein